MSARVKSRTVGAFRDRYPALCGRTNSRYVEALLGGKYGVANKYGDEHFSITYLRLYRR